MALSMVNRLSVPMWNSTRQGVCKAQPTKFQQVRHRVNNKHVNPKFGNHRRLKVMTVDPIPKQKPFILGKGKIDDDYWHVQQSILKPWNEREIYVSTSNTVYEEFVPPEDDASRSSILQKGKDIGKNVKETGKDKMAVRKIRQYERDFNLKLFVDEAKEIYIAAHECLASDEHEKLTDFVTEFARTAMLLNTQHRTIHWKYLQSLEEPKIVQIRTLKLDGDDDMFAQATIRFHSQQILAVYDRFGRIMYGSEILAKDVLEYVVFEKHLSNEYGKWRVHAKIIPDCLIRPADHTYVVPKESEELNASEVPVEAMQVQSDKPSTQVATS